MNDAGYVIFGWYENKTTPLRIAKRCRTPNGELVAATAATTTAAVAILV
jgi:hypothetical protein